MKITDFDYEREIRMDESALDVEWLEQPFLMLKYGGMLAEAKREVDQKREALDFTHAEISNEIRSDPKKFGLEKITEGAIQNTIYATKKYKEASKEYIDAKYEMEMARIAVQAVEQRKEALENLVRLHGQKYFAGPVVPRDIVTEAVKRRMGKEEEQQMNKGIASKLGKKKKVKRKK